ncbi:MAG TPA: hypothetical protein VFI28_00675, partial [Candidatus Limnocylindrales bacterium]|nr:hypothetical protein [Candidatus Limnocylindrales bacterium]
LRGPADRLDAILDGGRADRSPVALVRSALRSDPALAPAAIDELMAAYLAARDPAVAGRPRVGDDRSSGS